MRGVLGFLPAVLGTVMVALFGTWFGVTVGELTRLPELVVECREEVVYPRSSYTRTVCRYEAEDGEVVKTSPEGAEAARSAKRDPLTTKAVGLGLITGVSLVATLVLWRTARPERRTAADDAPPIRAPAPHYQGAGNYHLLLLMCGSRATADSLIAYERRLFPTASRAFLIGKAIERLRRDRDRQG